MLKSEFYMRKCPNCNNDIAYASKRSLDAANKNKSLCKKCGYEATKHETQSTDIVCPKCETVRSLKSPKLVRRALRISNGVCGSCCRLKPDAEVIEAMRKQRNTPESKKKQKQWIVSWKNKNANYAEEYRRKNKEKYKFNTYKYGAMRRGLSFDLSIEDFLTFWQKPCQYCGDEIKTIGLDRIDNDIGYVLSNVAPCCSQCNRAKNNLDYDSFIEWMKRLIKHNTIL
jgi:ribosomal protein S27E